jgi:hypothetical protein
MEEKEKSVDNISRSNRMECSIPMSVLKHIEKPPVFIVDPIGTHGTMIRLDRSILEKLLANPEDFKAATKDFEIILSAKPMR